MNSVYDNSTMVLGKVENVKKYLLENMDEKEDFGVSDILEELKDEKDDTIVAINYDCGMGYSIDYWEESDKVEVL